MYRVYTNSSLDANLNYCSGSRDLRLLAGFECGNNVYWYKTVTVVVCDHGYLFNKDRRIIQVVSSALHLDLSSFILDIFRVFLSNNWFQQHRMWVWKVLEMKQCKCSDEVKSPLSLHKSYKLFFCHICSSSNCQGHYRFLPKYWIQKLQF